MRTQNKIISRFTSALCVATAIYYLYVFWSGRFTPLQVMAPLVMVGLVLTFLTRPVSNRLPFRIALAIDCLLAALAVMACSYLIAVEPRIELLWVSPTGFRLFLASSLMIMILDATRRTLGWVLVIIILIFVFYALYGNYAPALFWHGGLPWSRLIYSVSLGSEGIWGIPTQVAASIVVLFMIFAAFLRQCGASEFILNLAQSLVGRMRGGPAKMSVIASALFGTMSGSSVANVVGTGVITIPLMKKVGYPAHIAGSFEAIASTGGQIVPPVMVGTAFIMAQFLGVGYWSICVAAFLPAVLYYLSLFMVIDLEAAKLGIAGLQRNEIPDWKPLIRANGHIFVPIIVLIVFLGVYGMSPATSCLYALISLWIVSFISKSTRFTPRKFYEALESSVRDMTIVTVSCAMASVLMGLVMATNLGMNLSTILIRLSGGNLALLLVLTAITALILGMGMSTTAVYVFLAILIGPALIQIGVPPIAAHFFILYYGILSSITPPFCVAAFVAAGIANCAPMKVGWAASRRGIVGMLIPFAFVYNPALVFQGSGVSIILTFVAAVIGVAGIVVATEGHAFVVPTRGILQRLLFGLGGAIMFVPAWTGHAVGIGIIALAMIMFYRAGGVKKEATV